MYRATTYQTISFSPAQSASRLPPALILALALIVVLLVIDIGMRTLPAASGDKTEIAGTVPATVPESANSAQKPFLGAWRGHSGETLIFMSDGALIMVWPASTLQRQESVTKLTWTEARGTLHYSDADYRWRVSANGKTMTLIPLKEDGSELSELAFALQQQ